MATQYTSILKLALPVTGELSGTWGDVVNNNITSMVEQAIAGLSTINTWTANAHTLTVADGTTSESRCAMLVAATGTGGTALTAAGEIICPAASKLYVLKNGAAYAVTLKTAAGTGVAVPAGDTAFLFCDGTNVNACVTTIVNGHISGNLTVDGNTTLGDANTDTVTVTAQFASDLLPSTDNARDLGSTAKSWRTLYCDTSVLVGNLSLAGNTLSSTDTNGNIVIAPNGTGDVQLDADTVRVGDSNANATITTNGTGDLILNTNAGTNSGSITIEDGVNGNILIATNGSGAVDMSTAVTMSATTQNIALGTSQTTGTWTAGGASQTGALTLDQSTKTHTLNLGTGATENALTKTINIGTAGVSGSTTTITIGSANGTTTTLNGTVTAATLNSTTIDTTNIEVTNIKAKDGTAALSIADSTGAVTVSSAFAAHGGATLGDASGDALTINSSAVSTPNGLNFDSDTFVIDATNNRVGIGTNAPTNLLTVSGTGSTPVAVVRTSSTVNAATYLAFQAYNASSAAVTYASLGSIITTNTAGAQSGALAFNTASAAAVTERMRLTADGQLNLGGNFTSTNNTLQVTGNTAIGYTTAAPTTGLIVAGNVGVGTDAPDSKLHVVSGASSTLAQLRIGYNGTSVNYYDANTHYFRDGSGPTNRMVLDSSGNLGLGVTPSGWGSGFKAIDIGPGSALSNLNSGTDTVLTSNSYRTSTNWVYKNSQEAGYYRQASGTHSWFTAPSGTANTTTITSGVSYTIITSGNQTAFGAANNNVGTSFTANASGTLSSGTVSQNISFTQAMTLDASGNLAVGLPSASNRIHVQTATTGSVDAIRWTDGATDTGYLGIVAGGGARLWAGGFLAFGAGGGVSYTERARIDSSGNLGLATNGTSFQWTNSGNNVAINGTSGVLSFYTGTSSYVERARIASNGQFQWSPDGSTQAMTLDASGNLGVGATSPSTFGKFAVYGNGTAPVIANFLGSNSPGTEATYGDIAFGSRTDGTVTARIRGLANDNGNGTDGQLSFWTADNTAGAGPLAERARITSGGDLLVGQTTTSSPGDGNTTQGSAIQAPGKAYFSSNTSRALTLNRNEDGNVAAFFRSGAEVGSISVTTTATAYNTSSDYRLKDNPQPLTGSGEFIDALQPKTWDWKSGGKGVGFIAHEAQAVSPSSVTGTKDAVDEDGNPIMQAMEYGSAEFIANIVAELQSLRARVAQLEGK